MSAVAQTAAPAASPIRCASRSPLAVDLPACACRSTAFSRRRARPTPG